MILFMSISVIPHTFSFRKDSVWVAASAASAACAACV
eukprot:SAG31_NODE_13188_length_887_cov_0.719543_2_plen_36_part_01